MLLSLNLKIPSALQVPEYKEPEKMRTKGNRWYGNAYVTDPVTGEVRRIEFSLDAFKWQKKLARINLRSEEHTSELQSH